MKIKKPEEINNWLLKAALDCVKDESSLDIDLSACAPIPSAPNDNTLSDVWNTNQETMYKEPAPLMQDIPDLSNVVVKVEKEENNSSLLQETTMVYFKREATATVGVSSILAETFKCKNCGEEFESKESLKAHAKVHRNSRRNEVYTCPVCEKQLKVSSMWLHRKIHNESERFSCDICGQKFVQKINLIHHTKAHLGEKPYECSQCQMSFPERSHLIKHQRYHASTREYKCEKCGKTYKTERCLKVHNLVHLEKRPFVCGECNKSFISSSKLKQHSNIHTGERPYKCKYCARDFTNFPNWLKHTRRRHKVDHKTGETLQNIPSYVTKKSEKKPKKPKARESASVELVEEKKTATNFADIYSMSLNSAEELIMEQALEMEECGYLMSPPSDATLGSPPLLTPFEYMSPSFQDIKPELPLSPPSITNFHYFLPPLSQLRTANTTATSNRDSTQATGIKSLPSVETLFASSYQKASSTSSSTVPHN